MGCEIFTHKPVLAQVWGHGSIFWTFVLVTAASLVPILRVRLWHAQPVLGAAGAGVGAGPTQGEWVGRAADAPRAPALVRSAVLPPTAPHRTLCRRASKMTRRLGR